MFSHSILGTVLKLLPRDKIAELVDQHGSDRWRKSFRTWDHLVAVLAGQFSGVSSLRELEVLFDEHRSQHYHLHCNGVKRSTLADANISRDHGVFSDIAKLMIARSGKKGGAVKKLLSVPQSAPSRSSQARLRA